MKKYIVSLLFCCLMLPLSGQFKNPRNLEFTWKTDTSIALVDLSEISLVLPKGSFPTLDYPKFIGKKEGLLSFLKHEPVLAVEINGKAKAYPLNLLSIHEISNDYLNDIPILATYCPLCNAGIVYNRTISVEKNEIAAEFQVSGMLRKSDMIMMDKKTESLWQQFTGKSIVGSYAGQELSVIPSLIISLEDFFKRYPDGRVISKTNASEEVRKIYGTNYYKGYDAEDGKPMQRYFDHAHIDDRLPPMERLIDVRVGEFYKVYTFSDMKKLRVINDSFRGIDVVLFYAEGAISILDTREIKDAKEIGSAAVFSPYVNEKKHTFEVDGKVIYDRETNSEWDITGRATSGPLSGYQLSIIPHSNHFAFAFLNFYPETEIYSADK